MPGARKSPSAKRTHPRAAQPPAVVVADEVTLHRSERVVAVLAEAGRSGLTASKDARISGRVSAVLIERAKTRTGIRSDTELVAFALANVAIEDDFVQVFRELRGTVDPDLDLDF